MEDFIEIKNACVNNLKGIDVRIPHNSITVITGLSGSGKSSLAFDTLYAEGQRRYVESLSAYVRQFLGRNNKPQVDSITGIAPAIAIEQKVNIRNPHSTVGSSTEIYDYIRLLFARIGKIYSPETGEVIRQDTINSVADFIMSQPKGLKMVLLSKTNIPDEHTTDEQLDILMQQGFSRIKIGNEYKLIQDVKQENINPESPLYVVIDRLTAGTEQSMRNRIADSLETAFYEGNGSCTIDILKKDSTEQRTFYKNITIKGKTFEPPTEQFFNSNNPLGACPTCKGFGSIIGIDEKAVIPDTSRSIYDNAIACWQGEIMSEWKKDFIRQAVPLGFPIHKPYAELNEAQKHLLWKGNATVNGIDAFFKFVSEQQYKIQYRVMLARYRGKTTCPDCKGSRLRPEVQWIKVGGKTITELSQMPICELKLFFEHLTLSDSEEKIAKRLLTEIKNRIRFLSNVGLGYLRLDRPSNTLSGGESQRINLASSIGSGLVGSLYILDEPSIGLHSRDTERLINVLRELQALGNTVIVVEHDEDIIRQADYIIDIGPNAGRLGGQIVYQGEYKNLITAKNISHSHTYDYLTKKEQIEIPTVRRRQTQFIEIKNASLHNLKNVEARFPLRLFTVVSGVSGSGKSSLVRDVLYESLKNLYENNRQSPYIGGNINMISHVEFVDQNPIGKSSRSNPATFIKAYDEIRKLFAEQQLSKQMGYTPAFFSFNTDGGRCEACQGEGTITIEMQFMSDLQITCEECHGKRFKQEVLDVLYQGKNIHDILEMTVDEALEFFDNTAGTIEKRIIKRLKPLQNVGLGYIKLGQSSSSLSGGESQRVKLASFLSNEKNEPTFFIFDEPTIGLHFHDIKKLLKAFDALIENGHTVTVIEHNMDVIKCADYIIDMGPDGGNNGGNVIFQGTPEELAKCPKSHTGKYLKEKLNKPSSNAVIATQTKAEKK